jgi:hypothetical protein
VHELGVEPQRDVVEEQAAAHLADVDLPLTAGERLERGDRIVAVESEVAGEVVSRSEGDADEREVAVERDLRDRRERPVAPGDADRVRVGELRELRRLLARLKKSRLDSPAARFVRELFRARGSAP